MDDLRAESYNAKEVAAKKRSIKRRVAVAGGVVALTLGLFSLTSCVDRDDRGNDRPTDRPTPAGGGGAWFNSDLEHLEDLEEEDE